MLNPDFLQSDIFNWVVLPMMIFLSRMTDVTLGTLRHIFISKGLRKIVPFLGFFEVLIWLIVISQIMKNLNNFMCYFAWAGGFATGTFIGMKIDEKLALGVQVLRVITSEACEELVNNLQKMNLGVTVLDGQGSKGAVKIVFTVIKRKDLAAVVKLLQDFNPNLFYSLEDVKIARQGVFPGNESSNYFGRIFTSWK
jgi:uncharacterized protein YebE (UPF0316 family)